jgi:hypothetical protein
MLSSEGPVSGRASVALILGTLGCSLGFDERIILGFLWLVYFYVCTLQQSIA